MNVRVVLIWYQNHFSMIIF